MNNVKNLPILPTVTPVLQVPFYDITKVRPVLGKEIFMIIQNSGGINGEHTLSGIAAMSLINDPGIDMEEDHTVKSEKVFNGVSGPESEWCFALETPALTYTIKSGLWTYQSNFK